MSTVPTLPAAPQRGTAPDVFIAAADAFVAALPGWGNAINVVAGEVNANAALANTKAAEALASANSASAAYSAMTALASVIQNSPNTMATVAGAIAVGTGAKTFTLDQTGKAFAIGQWVYLSKSSSVWMLGTVTAYNSGTGAMTLNVTQVKGSGSQSGWSVFPGNPGYDNLSWDASGNASFSGAVTVGGGLYGNNGALITNGLTVANGGLSVTAGGFSVAAGTSTFSGNAVFNSNLSVAGTLTRNGNTVWDSNNAPTPMVTLAGLINGSGVNANALTASRVAFGYTTSGTVGTTGTVVSFVPEPGSTGYSFQLNASYAPGGYLYWRGNNGDAGNTWLGWRYLWDSYNFNPAAYAALGANVSFNDISGNSVRSGEWFRSTTANRGWYNEVYSGGICMEDATYVRTFNNKSFAALHTHNIGLSLVRAYGGSDSIIQYGYAGLSDSNMWLAGISGGNRDFFWYIDGGSRMTLSAGGNLTVYGNIGASGNITAYSDERIKENWEDIEDSFIDSLAEVRHGSFNRIGRKDREGGVSAQSMLAACGNTFVTGSEAEGYGVNYGGAALVASIKLAQRLLAAEARLAQLEAR